METNGTRRVFTPKKRAFAREYVVDRNGTAAAIRAGFSEKTARSAAHRLLKDPDVREYIAELEAEIAERNDVEIDEIIGKLRTTYDNATGAKQFGPAVRAAELLGKIVGVFKDVIVESSDVPDDVIIERLAGGDPHKAAVLKQMIGKDDFE